MRNLLLFSLLVVSGASAFGQAKPTPASPSPAQPPTTQAPATQPPRATPPPAPRRAAPVATRGGLAITVTDPAGATLPGVRVEVLGASDRTSETNASGQLNLPGLQAGTYRLRFSGDTVISFEREVVLRAGQVANIDVTLNPAPPRVEAPPQIEAPPPAAAAAAVVGPAGQPQTLSLVDLVEREIIGGGQARKDTLVACSGNTRSLLMQLNQPQTQRVYEAAEALYYVIAGQGTVTVNGRDFPLQAGGYTSLPRGASHAFTRRGNRPLILLSVLSGEPCDQAK